MSQQTELLEYLQEHKEGISQLEAMNAIGSTRLAARVYDLRHKGYNVIAKKVKGINKRGKPMCYAQYVLEDNDN